MRNFSLRFILLMFLYRDQTLYVRSRHGNSSSWYKTSMENFSGTGQCGIPCPTGWNM